LQIRIDDLAGDKIIDFLKEHLEDMKAITPPESVNALDLEGLRVPEITFWSIWDSDDLVGSGALKEFDVDLEKTGAKCGEIKSMRTAKTHRGKGLGSMMLEHMSPVHKIRIRLLWSICRLYRRPK